MAGSEEDTPSPFAPLLVDLARMRRAKLTTAIDDVDKILDLLTKAREQVTRGTQTASIDASPGGSGLCPDRLA